MAVPTTGPEATEQLQQVEDAIMRVLREEPLEWRAVTDVRDKVQNGWPSTLVTAAIHQLASNGVLELSDRLLIRLAER